MIKFINEMEAHIISVIKKNMNAATMEITADPGAACIAILCAKALGPKKVSSVRFGGSGLELQICLALGLVDVPASLIKVLDALDHGNIDKITLSYQAWVVAKSAMLEVMSFPSNRGEKRMLVGSECRNHFFHGQVSRINCDVYPLADLTIDEVTQLLGHYESTGQIKPGLAQLSSGWGTEKTTETVELLNKFEIRTSGIVISTRGFCER